MSKVVFPENLQIKDPDPQDLDIFMFMPQYNTPIQENLIRCSNTADYINPDLVINEKIICGDSSDNIKSVARITKNGREYGVGKSDWKKISSQLNINSIQDLISYKEDISTEISTLKKFNNKINKEHILEMIEFNTKLVWLDENIIPEDVLNTMNRQEYKNIDIEYFKGSYKSIFSNNTGDPTTNEIIDLFEM